VAVAAGWWAIAFFATLNPSDPNAAVLDHRLRVLVAAVPTALLVYAGAAWDAIAVTAPRWLIWFGDRSYSIYLVHTVVNPVVVHLTLKAEWGHSRVPHVLWLGLMFASGIGAGLVFYWLVESRFMSLAKRRKKPAAPSTEVSPALNRRAA
jgi:peptidoglycan/LPS O-acetylase OafA/YrhL